MGIKRYIATSDNTISNAFQMDLQTRGTGSNMGAADTLETFYIYGQVSQGTGAENQTAEKSRILVQFDTNKISADRAAGILPASGNVAWYLNLYNAPHSFTLPKDFKMVVKVVDASWQEGYGLDMENYTDQTYEGTGSNWVRRGASGDGFGAWSSEGGDFAESSTSPAYTASFTDGTEDLSVDISHLVENWVDGNGVAADATGLLNGASGITDFDEKTFILTDYEATSVTFTFDKDVTSTGQTIGLQGLSTTTEIRNKIVDSINAVASLKITAANGNLSTTFELTMDAIGTAGNKIGGNGDFDASGATGHLSVFSTFQGGTDNTTFNYGLGVFLSSSFETGSHSYYTKKFFARSSEYFLLRPNLEARWDSTTKDSAANFAKSSSLATAEDNLNTLYLYNYVRGRLQNIPANASHADPAVNMKVSLYSNSAGNVYDKLPLPVGGDVASADDTEAVGGIVSTGIYTASLAMSHSLDSVYAVWHYDDAVVYHTSSEITVNALEASNFNPDPDYVTTIDNLKATYSREEEARFRLFVRSKNWNPNNYTVMQTELPSEVVEDAYFSLYRIVDDYVVIPFGTGSAIQPQSTGSAGSYTRLSYDLSGNYFDLDMELLQAGYEYGLKFAYYSNGSYREQKEVFKFRVEE